MTDLDALRTLVGDTDLPLWLELERLSTYNKDGKPYGVMGIRTFDTMTTVFARVADGHNDFTVGMLRDIIRIYKREDITLITDQPSAYDHIRQALKRYEFNFYYADLNGVEFMYSVHIKGE